MTAMLRIATLAAGLVMASAAWADIWTCDHTGATCWRTDANGVAMALSAITSAGTTQPLSNLGTVLGSSGPLPVIPPVIVGGGGFDGVISTSLPPKSCPRPDARLCRNGERRHCHSQMRRRRRSARPGVNEMGRKNEIIVTVAEHGLALHALVLKLADDHRRLEERCDENDAAIERLVETLELASPRTIQLKRKGR